MSEQQQLDDFARGAILPMWAQAVRDGERSVEGALREALDAISKMSEIERNRVGWRFTQQLLAIKPRKTRPRKPRGLPTAWAKFNHGLVSDLIKAYGLKKINPDAESRRPSAEKAFNTAESLWKAHGINVSSYEVMSAYYREEKKRKNST